MDCTCIRAYLDHLLAKLGSASAKERDFVRRARDLYTQALLETAGKPVEVNRSLEELRRAYANGEISEAEFDEAMDGIEEQEGLVGDEMLGYSIDENYERDIDTWDAQGRPDGEVFILGATGDVLQGLGAMEQDIYLRSEKVNTILQQHPEMTMTEIKRIPEILDDPVLVLKSRNAGRGGQQNTRLVLFGTVRAENGQPVLAVLDLRPVENGLAIDDMQKVTSSYTKDSNPVWYVQNSDILYADKNRTTPLLRTIGFQMPIELRRSGSMGSISYHRQNVKLEGVPFRDIVNIKENTSAQIDLTAKEAGSAAHKAATGGSVSMDSVSQNESGRKGETKYSFGGEKARTADLDALNRAQELERQGVAMDTIFRETGWFRGADGKWRFEIDDSGMEYSRWGDLRREDRAEFARFRELEGKFIDGRITMDEQNELRQLLEEGHGAGRAEEQQTLRLSDFVRHDELYQNYPQLRQAGLRFTRLPEGTRGTFDGQDIVLDESLHSAPEDTLVHEIQHAIQRAEGFTGGASPEGWQAVRQQVIDTVAGARQNLDLWLQDIGYPEYVRESMNRVVSGEITLDEHWKALEEFKKDSPFAAEIARCEEELANYENQLRMLNNLGDGEWGNSFDMYENTAGEIEARDVTARRQMTPEQRRQTIPNTGDERTVFAETLQELGSEYGMRDSNPPDGQGSLQFSFPEKETDAAIAENLSPGTNRNAASVFDGTISRNTPGHKGETKYSFGGEKAFQEDKYFARQMDRWANLEDGTRVKVGTVQTGSALNRVGLPASGMYFDVGKIKKAMGKHADHLTPAVLKEIPALLEQPVVVTQYTGPSGTVKNTVNVYGNLFVDGKPIVVGVVMRLDRSGRNVINNIRTIHLRSDFAKQINDDSVLYLNENKKMTRKWFQVCGNLNVPLEGTKFGVIRSIAFEGEDVKVGERQYSLPENEAQDNLPLNTKAEDQRNKVERRLVAKVGKLLNVPTRAQRGPLRDIAREISGEMLNTGTVSQETTDRLFDRAWDEGVVVAREFAEENAELERYLRGTRFVIAPEDAANNEPGSGHNREEAVPPLPDYFFFDFTLPRGLALAATRRASLSMWV